MGAGSMFAALLAVWNVWLLALWIAHFHVAPAVWLDAWRRNLPPPGPSLGVFLANGAAFVPAVAAAAGLLALAFEAGSAARAWLAPSPGGTLARGLIALTLGAGSLVLVMFGLGLAGLAFTPPEGSTALFLGVFAMWRAWRHRDRVFRVPAGLRAWVPEQRAALALSVLALAGVLSWLCVFNIETAWDALTYHLRLPSFYQLRHKVWDVTHNSYAPFPANVEMLFLLGRLASGDVAARLLAWAFGLAFLAAAASTAARLGAPRGWVVMMAASCPVVLKLMTRCYNDLPVAVCGSLSLLLLLDPVARSSGRVVLSGVLAGIGMGCKYTGVLVIPAALALTGIRSAATRRWAVAALVPFAPWLLKNWLARGNPVHPFLDAFMGLPAFRPQDHMLPFEGGAGLGTIRFGLADRLTAIPFDLGHVDAPLMAAVAGLLPLLLLRPGTGAAAPARRAALVFLAAWFLLAPEIRFLLPVVPLVLALGVGPWLAARAMGGTAARGLAQIAIAAGCLYAAGTDWTVQVPLSLPLGAETVADKEARVLNPAPFTALARDAVAREVPPGARILYLSSVFSYPVERECLTDFQFGPGHITRLLNEGRTAEGIARALRRRGIGWLMSTGEGAADYQRVPGYTDIPPEAWAGFKEFLARRTEAVWQTHFFALLRVTPPHPPRPLPAFPVYEAFAFADADRKARTGDMDAALAAYAAPPPLLADVGSTFARLGHARLAAGNPAGAVPALLRARALGVEDPMLRYHLAVALAHLTRYAEALPHARAARLALPRAPSIARLELDLESALERGR